MRLWTSLLFTCLLLIACRSPKATPTSERLPPERLLSVEPVAVTATPCLATIEIASTPSGAGILLDDASVGVTPHRFEISAGEHTLRLEQAGFGPRVIRVQPTCGEHITLSESMEDVAAPQVELGEFASVLRIEDGLKVVAKATDNLAVVSMTLLVDGLVLAESSEASVRHNIDTRVLTTGDHTLSVQAQDLAGNIGSAEATFTLTTTASPAPSATPSVTATPNASATAVPSPTSEATRAVTIPAAPTASASRPEGAVAVRWGESVIDTYAYEQALYTDPEQAGHSYPLLHWEKVGDAQPTSYRSLFLRNEYLELTFLPELGGRLYQCRYLPTDQTLLYNNQVIKPTHWGPEDQGWWLAIGGIEYCLPVSEHGYVSAEPWTPEIEQRDDGSATVTMTIQERSHHIEARVGVTLRPGEAAFEIDSELHNSGAQSEQIQYWINAMLSPGSPGIRSSLRFIYPTTEVIVHSRGDNSLPGAHEKLSWPVYNGRDLSRYAMWHNWLGFFATQLAAPFNAVYDDIAELGMVRIFPPETAKGSKLFGFGPDFSDKRAYTDDGSQYVEVWGGLTPTFWDDASLAPGERVGWQETWYPISRCDGVSTATAEVALSARRDGEYLELGVFAPAQHDWRLVVLQNNETVASEQLALRPDAPVRRHVRLGAGNMSDALTVRILDGTGRLVVTHAL